MEPTPRDLDDLEHAHPLPLGWCWARCHCRPWPFAERIVEQNTAVGLDENGALIVFEHPSNIDGSDKIGAVPFEVICVLRSQRMAEGAKVHGAPRRTSLVVEISVDDAQMLTALGDCPASVLAQLGRAAADGVRRPGSWEAPWIEQAFGDSYTERIEPEPKVSWRRRLRVSGPGDADGG